MIRFSTKSTMTSVRRPSGDYIDRKTGRAARNTGGRMLKFVVLLMLVAPLASAQSSAKSGRGATPDASAGAQAGDDALTCDQLYAEMNTLMTGSGMQNMLAQQQLIAGQSLREVAKHPELLPKGSTGVS